MLRVYRCGVVSGYGRRFCLTIVAPLRVVGIVSDLVEEVEHEGRGIGGCDSSAAMSSFMIKSPGEWGEGMDYFWGCVVGVGVVTAVDV